MTDGCGTQSTQEGMGLVKAKGEFSRKITHCHGHSAVVCSQFEAVSGAGKVCEFHAWGNGQFDNKNFACFLE